MKKLLKTVLSLGAALLGVVAFCMIFVAPLSFVYERILTGETVTMELAWNYVFIGGRIHDTVFFVSRFSGKAAQ